MQRLTPLQALQKIKYYCAYQERSHSEVKSKLYGFGLYKNDVEEIIATLITENYLNEERFACLYAGSKFRTKQWGRKKILQGLKQRNISPYNIRLAMKEIDDETYNTTLLKLTQKKWSLLKDEQYIVREAKTRNYLLQKGFEPELVSQAIKKTKEK